MVAVKSLFHRIFIGIFAFIVLSHSIGSGFTFVHAAQTAQPLPDSLKKAAWEALQKCDESNASLWAQLLEKQDPETALLYRLAWLQVPLKSQSQLETQKESPKESKDKLGQDPWKWKKNQELWQDEVDLISSGHSCRTDLNHTLSHFDQLPQEVLHQLLWSRFESYFSYRAPLRTVLRKYALHLWQKNSTVSPIDFEKMNSLEGGTTTAIAEEKCQLKALKLIYQSPSTQQHPFEALLSQCPLADGLLGSTFLVKGGDIYWQKGEMGKAFTFFQKAVDHLPGQGLTQSLNYRMAVSGLLGDDAPDVSLRIAYRVLKTEEDPSTTSTQPLNPMFRKSLQNLVCEKLIEMQPKETIRVLEKIFLHQPLVENTLILAKACTQPETEPLWKLLLSRTKDIRQRTILLGLLIQSSLQRNSINPAKTYTIELAKLSFQSSILASHHFWNALTPEQVTHHTRSLLAKLYLSKAQSLSTDVQRLNRLEEKSQSTFSKHEGPLKKDTYESKNVTKLPFALLAPPASLNGQVSIDLIGTLFQEFNL